MANHRLIAATVDLMIYKSVNYKAKALLASIVGVSSFTASKLGKSLPDVTKGLILSRNRGSTFCQAL